MILFQGLANNISAHVYLDYPQGGESFPAFTIITIQWHIAIPHEQLNWDLLFSTDGGNTWEPIQMDLPVSQLTYTWVVPDISTSLARISIIQDNVDMDYQDESMDFTIIPASMAPFIDITAQNLNLECNISNQQTAIQNWLNIQGGATAVGQCGNLVWTHDYVGLSNECGATGNAYVTFTATDSCGSAVTSAYLSVIDTISPVMQTPANNIVAECGGNTTQLLNNWLANHGGATASDACGNVTWTYQASEPSNGCGITGSTSVMFIATDECGNSSTTSAEFSVEDSLAPGIVVPAQDYTLSCATPDHQTLLQNWLANQGGAMAFDDCGNNVTWTNNFTALSDGCGTTGSALVTFTATDACGHSASTLANFAIIDNSAPYIITPARDTTINCADADAHTSIKNWLSNHGGATASDNCGSVFWTHDFPPSADSCKIFGSFSVAFTSSDPCGNSDTTNATITIATTTGTDNSNLINLEFKISPNPASDFITITFDRKVTLPVLISLFDSRGKFVLSEKGNASEISITVNGIVPGVYFLQVGCSQGVYTRKVIIN